MRKKTEHEFEEEIKTIRDKTMILSPNLIRTTIGKIPFSNRLQELQLNIKSSFGKLSSTFLNELPEKRKDENLINSDRFQQHQMRKPPLNLNLSNGASPQSFLFIKSPFVRKNRRLNLKDFGKLRIEEILTPSLRSTKDQNTKPSSICTENKIFYNPLTTSTTQNSNLTFKDKIDDIFIDKKKEASFSLRKVNTQNFNLCLVQKKPQRGNR